jgi:hypothetical protein
MHSKTDIKELSTEEYKHHARIAIGVDAGGHTE